MPGSGISDFAKDTVLSLLQEFFSNEKNVGADLVYSRDETLSRVAIVDKYTINLKDVDKRPAIVVIRGAQTWGRKSIGQFAGWTGPNTADKFTDLVNGAVNCTCMSTNGLEAEKIAWTVFAFFQMFRKRILETTKKLHDVQSLALGEELAAQTDSKIDVSVVPVSLSLAFNWSWTMEQQGPPLADVDVKTYLKNSEVFTKFLASATPKLAI